MVSIKDSCELEESMEEESSLQMLGKSLSDNGKVINSLAMPLYGSNVTSMPLWISTVEN